MRNGKSSLYSPEPLTEIVLTWYVGTPATAGPINLQFYGFRGHQVTPQEVFKMLEIVYQGLQREVAQQQAVATGQTVTLSPPTHQEVPA